MNPPKCDEMDYINFLIAAQQVFSSVEASQTHPAEEQAPAHDAYTRLLKRLPPDSQALWQEVKPLVDLSKGVLIIDDSTLDKPYASHMALVTRHWSGKHHAVVQGINLISLVWTNRECRLPCDFRLYNKAKDGFSKNDHFQHMLEQAKERGFEPDLVVFDSWYSGLPNLKLLRSLNWHWLTVPVYRDLTVAAYLNFVATLKGAPRGRRPLPRSPPSPGRASWSCPRR